MYEAKGGQIPFSGRTAGRAFRRWRGIAEIMLAYPGFLALAAHRLAHRLHALAVSAIAAIAT